MSLKKKDQDAIADLYLEGNIFTVDHDWNPHTIRTKRKDYEDAILRLQNLEDLFHDDDVGEHKRIILPLISRLINATKDMLKTNPKLQ